MKVLICLLLLACSHHSKVPVKKVEKVVQKKSPFRYQVSHLKIYNGKVKFVQIRTNKPNGVAELTCVKPDLKNDHYRGEVKNGLFSLYFAESYFSKPHKKKCYLGKHHVLNVVVQDFPYKRERLNVPKRKVDLSKKDLDRVLKEMEIKKDIYKKTTQYFQFDQPFTVPLGSKITSTYGNQRLFNDKKKSQHLGNDLRAAVGVKIPATNRGTVVFTGDLFFSGKIVVIDHGLEIFTVYMHLSKIKVKKGDIVTSGDIVGLAGRTGRVSGPHLHWGVRINNHWVDGFSLVKESSSQFLTTRNL